jgi:hypothetical protein
MRSLAAGLAFAAFAIHAPAEPCTPSRKIAYEPHVAELKGTVSIARARHPNRTWMTYPVMRLTQPVSIQADGVNPINSSEACIPEVQLTSNDPEVRGRLFSSQGKHLVVRGTVFHEHTAWHMRRLVMIVSEIR